MCSADFDQLISKNPHIPVCVRESFDFELQVITHNKTPYDARFTTYIQSFNT